MKKFVTLAFLAIASVVFSQTPIVNPAHQDVPTASATPFGVPMYETDPSGSAAATISHILGLITVGTGAPGGGTPVQPPFYWDDTGNDLYAHDGASWATVGGGGGGLVNWSESGDTLQPNGDNTQDFGGTGNRVAQAYIQEVLSYNLFTDASNYELAQLVWDTNVFEFRTTALGTGTARSIRVDPAAVLNVAIAGTDRYEFDSTAIFPSTAGLDLGRTSDYWDTSYITTMIASTLTSVAAGDITIDPDTTGNIILGNFNLDADATVGAGQDNYVLTYDHSTQLWGPEAGGVGGGDAWSDPVDAVITPDADGTRDLATTVTRFATGYFDNLDVTTDVTAGGTFTSNAVETDTIDYAEQADGGAPAAGFGRFWVRTDNTPMFTDEADADTELNATEVLNDTTPQLGGPLDVNSQKIVSTANGDIDIEPNGTGNVLLGNHTIDADQALGVGQDNYVMTYDNGTGLWSAEAAAGGGLTNWSESGTTLQPNADGTQDFGASGNKINDIHMDGSITFPSTLALTGGAYIWNLSSTGWSITNANRGVPQGSTGARWGTLFNGRSLTGAESAASIDVDSIWNTTGTPSLLKLNVLDTASNAASLLIEAEVGGVDQFSVSKSGNLSLTGTVDGRNIDADGTKLDGIEALADVTDTANVTAAGALMDSEVDADIQTFALPANTTISAFGATLVDDADAPTARTTLGIINQTDEEIQDIAGPLVATGGTKTGITVTYQDATGDMDFETDVTLTGAETLTNKTIDGDNNTLSNLDLGNEVDWAVISDVTDRTAFQSGDKILIFEAGVGMRKADFDDLPGAGGGANTNLGNLTATAINLSLISDTDITDDLGSAAIRWNDIYAATAGTGDTAADTFKLRGRDIDGASWVDVLTVTANNDVTADLWASTTIGGADIVTPSTADTLTNKILNADNNTVSGIDLGLEAEWATITDLTDRTAFEAGDKLMIFEAGVGMRRIDYTDLPAGTGDVTKVGTPVDNQVGVWTGDGTIEGDASLTFDRSDLILYEAVNDGNPQLKIGSADAEELRIQTVYDAVAQTMNRVDFITEAASATADKGLFRFSPDGVAVLDVDDGGIEVTGAITVSGQVDGRDLQTDGTKLDGVEALADVTDTANVTAAGALMDSEVDADIQTLALPANTTISAYGATLVDDADAATARTTLGVINQTNEEIEDIAGPLVATGGTKTGITVTYQDATGDTDFVVSVSTSEVAAATLVTESETIASNDNDTTLPTSAAVKDYSDNATATQTNKTLDSGSNTIRIHDEEHTGAGPHTLTASDCYNGVHYVTAASTVNLPAVADGMSLTIISEIAGTVVVNPNGTEVIKLDGTSAAAGENIESPGAVGDIVTLTYRAASTWYAASNSWTEETP